MADGIMEKLEQEEKEAEKLLYGDGDELPEGDAQVSEDGQEPTLLEEATNEEKAPESTESKKERTSWKKRFTSYKASTDQTINQLRQDRAKAAVESEELRTQLADLATQVKLLEQQKLEIQDPMDGIISQDEADLLGPEAVTVLKKIAGTLASQTKEQGKPEIDALRMQLAELQKKRKEDAIRQEAELARTDMDKFKDRLVKAVPDFDDIDTDEKFGEFLEGVDDASGRQRIDLYKTAITGRDVIGVARFYNDFRAARPKSKEDILEEQITPEAKTVSQALPVVETDGGNQKRFHVQEYNEFMDDVNKGLWKGREKEAAKIETMFDKAFVDDRIDGL